MTIAPHAREGRADRIPPSLPWLVAAGATAGTGRPAAADPREPDRLRQLLHGYLLLDSLHLAMWEGASRGCPPLMEIVRGPGGSYVL